jgi:hypothetical protein
MDIRQQGIQFLTFNFFMTASNRLKAAIPGPSVSNYRSPLFYAFLYEIMKAVMRRVCQHGGADPDGNIFVRFYRNCSQHLVFSAPAAFPPFSGALKQAPPASAHPHGRPPPVPDTRCNPYAPVPVFRGVTCHTA